MDHPRPTAPFVLIKNKCIPRSQVRLYTEKLQPVQHIEPAA